MANEFNAAGYANSLLDDPVEEKDEFDANAFGLALGEQSALQQTLGQAVAVNPDDHANVVRLSDKTGLPTDVVEGGGDDIKQRERVHDIDVPNIHKNSPVTTNKLLDLDFAKVAHDDVENLSTFESLFEKTEDIGRAAIAGAPKAIGMGLSGLGSLNEAFARSITRGIESVGLQTVADLLRTPTPLDFLSPTEILRKPGELLKEFAGEIEPPVERQTLVTDIAGGVGQIVGQITASIINPASGIAMLFGQGADQQAERADALGSTEAEKDAAVIAGASVTALTEKIGLDLLLNRIPPNIKNGIMRQLTDISIAGGIESVQEIIEGIGQNLVEVALLNSDIDVFSGLEREALAAGGSGAVFRSLLNATVKGRSFVADRQKAKQAQLNQSMIEAMGESAAASKVRERLPAKYREFVEAVKNGGEVTDVYVDAEKVSELFQAPRDGDLDVEMPYLRESVEEALATDDFVAIPLEDYQTFIAGTDDHAALAKDIKFHFDEMSLNEAEQYEQELQETFNEEFAAVSREAGVEEISEDVATQVFDQVRTQLQTAGRETQVAGNEALAHKAFARVLQKRYGLTPEQVGSFYGGLAIKGELPEAIRQMPKGGVDLLLERIRRGVGKPDRDIFGQTLVDFVRDRGIDIESPEITELRGFDIDKDLKPFQRKALREGGQVLDELAKSAQEAGFFPEIDPEDRIDIQTLIDAIDEGLRGVDRFQEGVVDEAELGRRQTATDLAREIDRRGIDINLPNEEIIRLLEEQEVTDEGALFQPTADISEAELDFDAINEIEVEGELTTPELMAAHHTRAQVKQELFDAGMLNDDALDEFSRFVDASSDASMINELREASGNLTTIEETYEENLADVNEDFESFTVDDFEFEGDILEFSKIAKGTTESVGLAGYILPDGDMLDFSGGQGERFEDHRQLNIPTTGDLTGTDAMIAFQKAGAMRIDANSKFVDMEVLPTNRQLRMIDEVFGGEGGRVSLADGNRKADFTVQDADKAAGLIRRFYRGEDITEDEFFQIAEGEEVPRGAIQFLPDEQTIISLKETADLSTFLHETGHFFVHVLEQIAPQSEEAQRDLDVMMKFVGAKSADEFSQVEKQEKLARGFEAYLREGKAPSVELQSAFSRFKSWLLNVYRELLRLDVQLTDEMRETFDRMLATDQEIEAAEQFNKFTIDENLASILTPAERKRLEVAGARASDAAEEELLKRKIKELEREETKVWKAERVKIREEVAESVNRQPDYRAIDMLRNKENDIKMNRRDVEDLRGSEIFALIPTGLVGKDGVHPDVVADLVGAESGDALLLMLMNSAPNKTGRNKVIDDQTDAIMNERHGSLNENKRHAVEAANEAVFSDDRAKFIALEVKLLTEQAGEVLRGAAERDVADLGADEAQADRDAVAAAAAATDASGGDIGLVVDETFEKARAKASITGRRAQRAGARQARIALNIPASVMREQARRIINRNKVGNVIQFGRYTNASQKFGKQATLAIARRDYAEAAELKQRQLLHHYLALESLKAQKELDSALKYFNGFKKKAKRKNVHVDYLDQIDALLDRFDFKKNISNKQIERRKSLVEFVLNKEANGEAIEVPERLLNEAFATPWREMTLDDLRGLKDAVKNIEHLARLKKKLLDAKEKRELDEIADDIINQIDTNLKSRPLGLESNQNSEKIKRHGRSAMSLLFNADTILREIDGFVDLGPMYQAIKGPIDKAMDNYIVRQKTEARSLIDLFNIYTKKERLNFNTKAVVPETNISLTKQGRLSVALNAGNADNRRALVDSKQFKDSDIDAILKTLDERDWQFVQGMWDYIDGFWPEIADAQKRRTGVVSEKVERVPVIVNGVQVAEGGYYPLKYDKNQSVLAAEEDVNEMINKMRGGRFAASHTNRNHTIERKGSGGRKVLLDLQVPSIHIDTVIYDIELGDAVHDTFKKLHHKRVKKAFEDAGHLEKWQGLDLWLGDITTNEIRSADTISVILRWARTGFTISKLAWNVSTMLLQPLGILQTSVQLGKVHTAKGLKHMLTTPWFGENSIYKFVQNETKFMASRASTFNKDITDAYRVLQNSWVQKHTPGDVANYTMDTFFVGIMRFQQFVDTWTWMSAVDKGMVDFDGDYEKAKAFADRTVARSQASGVFSDRTPMERGTISSQYRQTELMRVWTPLISYFMAKTNVAYERTKKTNFRNPVQIANWALDMSLLYVIEAILVGAIRGQLPDEDDDDTLLGFAVSEGINTMMAGIPIIREAASAAKGFPGGGVVGSVANEFGRVASQVSQGEIDAALLTSINSLGGIILKYPASQINKTGRTINNVLNDEDVELIEFLMGPSFNK